MAEADASATDELWERYRPALRRMIGLRLDHAVSRRLDASDVVQEVLFKASQRLGEYRRKERSTRRDGSIPGTSESLTTTDSCILPGRIKDVIVLDSGKNVYPDELEDFIVRSHRGDRVLSRIVGKGREIAAAHRAVGGHSQEPSPP